MQTSRALIGVTLIQVAAGALAVLATIAMLGGGFRSPDSILFSPNAYLGIEIVLVGLLVWATRRRSRLTDAVQRERAQAAGELAEHDPPRYALMTLQLRSRVRTGTAQLQTPTHASWADDSLISASLFDREHFSLPDCGIQTFRTVADLQQFSPDGNLVAIVARLHPETMPDPFVEHASRSRAVTPVRIWGRPGTRARDCAEVWAAEAGVMLADTLPELVDGVEDVEIGEVSATRLPRRRSFVTSYWYAAVTESQRVARCRAAVALLLMLGASTVAAAALIGWGLLGAAVDSTGDLASLSAAVVAAIVAGSLYPVTRRLDDAYGVVLTS